MATDIELYEALRSYLGDDVARMVTDRLPPIRDLATKDDLERLEAVLRTEIERLETLIAGEVRRLDEKIDIVVERLLEAIRASTHETQATMTRRLLAFAVPVMVGMAAQIAALAAVMIRLV